MVGVYSVWVLEDVYNFIIGYTQKNDPPVSR